MAFHYETSEPSVGNHFTQWSCAIHPSCDHHSPFGEEPARAAKDAPLRGVLLASHALLLRHIGHRLDTDTPRASKAIQRDGDARHQIAQRAHQATMARADETGHTHTHAGILPEPGAR